MMSRFLADHRPELIARCTARVALRPHRHATELQLRHGIPLFLTQLQRTLEAENAQQPGESLRISGAAGGRDSAGSEMGLAASAHGKQLLDLGLTVDQVVHDYGDLCQSITELAFERNAPVSIPEFRTLNRCLDNAIANAVMAFSMHRDLSVAARNEAEVSERIEALLLSLRSSLASATYAVAALQLGNLPMTGSTGAILKHSLETMRRQVGGPSLAELKEGPLGPD